jgi:cobyrinic acid a,c-diamide synthase
MENKLFEVFYREQVVVLATRVKANSEISGKLFAHADIRYKTPIILTDLHSGHSRSYPHEWATVPQAVLHSYIHSHWDDLDSGSLIDLSYISLETKSMEESIIL